VLHCYSSPSTDWRGEEHPFCRSSSIARYAALHNSCVATHKMLIASERRIGRAPAPKVKQRLWPDLSAAVTTTD
jgi:hypothetical protein